ncbi:hydroxyproline-rich glycoprotein family protein [Quillaja saponaria]|uniref:Hydroxyproline-rich glycoprotein family protein n=1 Tax=Quillaja saponaria TaxID=32244 RepID=A0AAD7PI56_QUISA|nr:hydroxyproline-rich glycoprotein family protein [Quillaja saponaria]KAJ7955799.1 hydroxyproline-rich glycoprotein family protein [Quillaja saponaria]
MALNRESTPPPVIGKIGPYTVFMTPPSTPKPSETVFDSPKKIVPPPVQPPPQQFAKSLTEESVSSGSVLGFFQNAVAKVQNAHSNLDDHLARWFGLNQSKYQWALDDYFESKGMEKDVKVKEISSKVETV